jgi:hypothetical protein
MQFTACLRMYAIVRNQPKLYKDWGLTECKTRKKAEAKKLLKYLFNSNEGDLIIDQLTES